MANRRLSTRDILQHYMDNISCSCLFHMDELCSAPLAFTGEGVILSELIYPHINRMQLRLPKIRNCDLITQADGSRCSDYHGFTQDIIDRVWGTRVVDHGHLWPNTKVRCRQYSPAICRCPVIMCISCSQTEMMCKV